MSARAEQIKVKMDKYTKLLEDPEIAEMVAANPKLGEAVKDVQLLTLNRQAFQVLLGPIHARLKVSYETGNMKAQSV